LNLKPPQLEVANCVLKIFHPELFESIEFSHDPNRILTKDRHFLATIWFFSPIIKQEGQKILIKKNFWTDTNEKDWQQISQ